MLKTVSQAAKYVIETVKEYNPEEILDQEAIVDIIEDLLLEKLENEVSAEDIEEIINNTDNEEYINAYLQNKVPKYYTILDTIVKEILTDYITETE